MAAELEVSRGSFYWHFVDIRDFRSQLLQSWAEATTNRVRQELEADTDLPDRLRALVERALGSRLTLDRAIRAWATEDESVARIVADVDSCRLDYIEELLRGAGVPDRQSARRAAFLYWALLGRTFTMDPDRTASAARRTANELCQLFAGQFQAPAKGLP